MLRRTSFAALMTLMTLATTATFAIDDPKVPGSPANRRATVGKGDGAGLRKLDTDKDGQISKPEFENAARKLNKKGQGKAGGKGGARVFDRLDTDNNGKLSPAELEKLKQLRARKKAGR
jgi:hypothetical protein